MEKINVLVVGCTDWSGQLICDTIAKTEDFVVVAGYDLYKSELYGFPIFCSVENLERWKASNHIDIIFDCSWSQATLEFLGFAEKYNIPMVIYTTDFSDEDEEKIQNVAKCIQIFKSACVEISSCPQCPLVIYYPCYKIFTNHKFKRNYREQICPFCHRFFTEL